MRGSVGGAGDILIKEIMKEKERLVKLGPSNVAYNAFSGSENPRAVILSCEERLSGVR